MSHPSGRVLTPFEQQVLLAWRGAPKALWSKPNLYKDGGQIPNRTISAVQSKGLAAIGFSKEKVFDYCLSLLQERVPLEDSNIEHSVAVLNLLSRNGGEVCHYIKETGKVKVFRLESGPSYGGAAAYNDYYKRMRERLGDFTFLSHESGFNTVIKSRGDSWATSNVLYKNLDFYPEIDVYLKQSNQLLTVNQSISNIANLLPVLFDIGGDQINQISIKPCFISNGKTGFYLHSTGRASYGIILNYEGVSLWTI